jgi:hypothetical protein
MENPVMPRKATTAPIPDLDVLTEVLRLTDAVDAEWQRRPASPVVVSASSTPEPTRRKKRELLYYLAGLDADHQARLHALFWMGREHTARARHYSSFDEQALTTDLGRDGAAYLAGKALGVDLRRGLKKLGLGLDRARPNGTQDSALVLEERTHA